MAALLPFAAIAADAKPPAPSNGFRAFLASVWPEAAAAGVRRKTFDGAVKGLEPDLTLPDLEISGKPARRQSRQAEFSRPPGEYLGESTLDRLAATGRDLARRHAAVLAEIERRTGVDRFVVLAIFGRETAFGSYRLPHDAIRVLATQAWIGRRKEQFRKEFVLALKMLEDGVPRRSMRSSWAGAMGLTQFLPSEFYQHARSHSGDAPADLFTSVPDALASAARQLQAKGWVRGEPWGFEVIRPAAVDCAFEGPPDNRPVRDWLARGIRPASGRQVPDALYSARGYLMSPAGAHGPSFLALENFQVIRRYNTSDLYATFVGSLADRIAGRGGFVTSFATVGSQRTEVIRTIQSALMARGYAIDKVDGFIGSSTRREVGRYQRANRLAVDCWPSIKLAEHMKRSRPPRDARRAAGDAQ
ncbi:MAG: lytic murein transglycosylase [Hyphomicrobiaceae bacterium]